MPTEEERKVARERYLKYKEKHQNELGKTDYDYKNNLRMFLRRNPDKTEANYKPRPKRVISEHKGVPSNNDKLLKKIHKPEKEKVEIIKIPATSISNKVSIVNEIIKATKPPKREREKRRETLNRNLTDIANLYRLMFKKEWKFDSLEFLRNTDKIAKLIERNKKWSVATKSHYFYAILGITKFVEGYENEHQFFSRKGRLYQDQHNEFIDAGLTTQDEEKNKMSWSEILALREVFNNWATAYGMALYSCITQVAGRRALDWRVMRIITTQQVKELGGYKKLPYDYNYLVVSSSRLEPHKIIFLNYKSQPRKWFAKINKNRGEYVYDIERGSLLFDDLKDYIRTGVLDIDKNDYLFGKESDLSLPMKQSSFSNHIIRDIFLKYAEKRIGFKLLRKIYISSKIDDLNTPKDMKAFGYSIGTSFTTAQFVYNKKQLKEHFIKDD
jgi:hypothetical protein